MEGGTKGEVTMTASESVKRVLVCGATGYLGRHVVQAAKAEGYRVRALVREEARLGDAGAACDEVFVGEATRAETLRGLCDGVDLVISSLGNRTLHRRPTVWELTTAPTGTSSRAPRRPASGALSSCRCCAASRRARRCRRSRRASGWSTR
jgi:NAD(P)-dependent dehydrogenase (short-subunit alcohol dehydrogenase family)